MNRIISLYFSSEGTIGRGTWWLSTIGIGVASWLSSLVALSMLGVPPATFIAASLHPTDPQWAETLPRVHWVGLIFGVLYAIPATWPSIKRRRQRGQSGIDTVVLTLLGLVEELALTLGLSRLPSPGNLPFLLVTLAFFGFSLYMLVVLGFLGPKQPDSSAAPDKAELPEASEAPDARRAQNPVARFWRGQYPLGPSYWAVNVLAGLTIEVSAAICVGAFEAGGTVEPVVQVFGAVLFALAFAALFGWLRVGTWRSASRRARAMKNAGHRTFWPRLAQAMLILPALEIVAVIGVACLIVVEYYPIAFLGDPGIPAYTLVVSPDGTELTLTGGVKFGLGGALEKALHDAPGIKTLVLASPGGRLGAALEAVQVIKQHRLDTYVPGECDSICPLIFVAGTSHLLQRGARLGFHSATLSRSGIGNAFDAVVAKQEIASFVAAGVDPAFMRRVVTIPPQQIWYPSIGVLEAAHVITGVVGGTAPAVSPLANRDGDLPQTDSSRTGS